MSTKRQTLDSQPAHPRHILDGGMGHLLRRKGVPVSGAIGSMERFLNVALANRNQKETVCESHLDFLRAGANVITTNNYACVPSALALSPNPSPQLITDLIDAAGQIARQACQLHVKELPLNSTLPMVAGCVPPLHESYRPDRVGSERELTGEYAHIVEAIAPHADLLLCETMSSVREGKLAAQAANQAGIPVWIAWTLAEDASGKLRSGESVQNAVRAVNSYENVQAMLFNCSSAASITAALPQLREAAPSSMLLGSYANGFQTVKVSGGDREDSSGGQSEYDGDSTPEAYAKQAQRWVEQGVEIVGGCCGIFPEHIHAIERRMRRG